MTSKQKQKHPSIFYPCVKLDTIQNPPTQQQQQKQKQLIKIKKLTPALKNEIYISDRIIANIPNYSHHFSPIIKHSLISLAEIDDDITPISRHSTQSGHVLLTMAASSPINKTIPTKTIPTKTKTIIHDYLYLLTALQILESNQLVHGNINWDNIHYNTTNQLLLSDFSYSFDFTPLHISNADFVGGNECKGNVTMRITNAQRCKRINEERKRNLILSILSIPPIELFIAQKLSKTHTSLSVNIIDELCDEYITRLQYPAYPYKDALIFSLVPFINRSNESIINDLLDKYLLTWYTIDNYSLSVLYLRLCGQRQDHFTKILLQNIHPDITKRLTLNQTFYNIETCIG